jgi:hypothetical protein
MSSDGCASVGDSCQSADIWYSYTKSDADESINTCSTQRDSGVVLSLSHLAEGETAFIRVSHHADSAEGPINLRVLPEPSTTVLVLVGWAWLLVLHRCRIHRQGQSRRGS